MRHDAKPALIKVLGKGLEGFGLTWKDLEVSRTFSGAASVQTTRPLATSLLLNFTISALN